MKQTVSLAYDYDAEQAAIQVRVSSTPPTIYVINPRGEPEQDTSRQGEIFLTANKHGFALLYGMLADFLLDPRPEQLVYRLTEQDDMNAGSPGLVFTFDPALDNEPEDEA